METIRYEDASQPQQAAFRGSLWQAKILARHPLTSPDRKADSIAKLRRLAAGQAIGPVVPSAHWQGVAHMTLMALDGK